jgi:hypothetical protein
VAEQAIKEFPRRPEKGEPQRGPEKNSWGGGKKILGARVHVFRNQ